MRPTLQQTPAMKLSELTFDASGQSQGLLGSFAENTVDPVSSDDAGNYNGNHFCWVRRARHYPMTKADLSVKTNKDDANDGWVYLYWLVGVDGQILSSAVREDALPLLLEGRNVQPAVMDIACPVKDPNEKDPEESEEDYNRRTNHGAF